MDRHKVKLSNDTVVWIDTVPTAPVNPEKDVARSRSVESFQSVLPSLIALCSDLKGAVEKVRPEKATVEFGLSFTVDTGGLALLVAKAGAEATFNVTLEWSAPSEGYSR